MSRPTAKKLPLAVLACMIAGAVLFAATAAFVVGPALFPRPHGTFSVVQVLLTGIAGMLGSLIGVGLGNRLFDKPRRP